MLMFCSVMLCSGALRTLSTKFGTHPKELHQGLLLTAPAVGGCFSVFPVGATRFKGILWAIWPLFVDICG